MKKQIYFNLFLLIAVFAAVIQANPGFCQESPPSENSLGEFQTGKSADIFKYFGIPVPIEEGGYHLIYNPKEQTYFRALLTYLGPKKWLIKTMRVSNRDQLLKKVRLSDHLMVTGISMSDLQTGKGIKLGSLQDEVAGIYGPPTHKKTSDNIEEWIYIRKNNTDNSREYFSFIFSGGKVTAINIGNE